MKNKNINNLIDKNYEWFKNNLPELVKTYDGQYVVVKDERVVAAYSSFNSAFKATIKKELPGTFIIQLCSLDKEKTTQMVYTPGVNFA